MITRKRVDNDLEKQMLVAMITSDDFLKQIEPAYDPSFVSIPFVNTVAQWCLAHHRKYKKAPQHHIQEIFKKREKNNNDQENFDLIADFLDTLSNRSKKKLQVKPLYDGVVEHFNLQQAKQAMAHLEDAIERGDSEKAISLLSNKDLKLTDLDLSEKIKNAAQPIETLLKEKIQKPPAYIRPWLRKGTLTMVCGEPGVGKTFFTYILAICLTRRHYDELFIGNWDVRRRAGVLIVDGEMDKYSIKQRLGSFTNSVGKKARSVPLNILSSNGFCDLYEDTSPPSLEDPKWRLAITEYLKAHPEIEIVILDNLYSLINKTDLNDTKEWTEINTWLLSLRHQGLTIVLVHHVGKSGEQLGAKAKEFNLDNTIYLRHPRRGKKKTDEPQEGGFVVDFGKARHLKPEEKQPFTITIDEDEDGFTWSTT